MFANGARARRISWMAAADTFLSLSPVDLKQTLCSRK